MKRTELKRKTPLTAKTGLARRTPLAGGTGLSWKQGLERKPATAPKRKAPRDTGPSRDMRAMVLERDGASCLRCGASIAGRPYSIHHRKRRSQSGGHTFDNLVTLCGDGVFLCHGWVHAHVSEAFDAGWLVPGSADPAHVPVLIASPHGSGALVYLSADGTYSAESPKAVAA